MFSFLKQNNLFVETIISKCRIEFNACMHSFLIKYFKDMFIFIVCIYFSPDHKKVYIYIFFERVSISKVLFLLNV